MATLCHVLPCFGLMAQTRCHNTERHNKKHPTSRETQGAVLGKITMVCAFAVVRLASVGHSNAMLVVSLESICAHAAEGCPIVVHTAAINLSLLC